ncbi:WD40 repeat-like protein [Ascodesmis nigricans]|uniref:WD40 repeat-like protein n=1 Tax=Ascodesmis nigricans TaxID=341454 RepID=A0A4S2ML74_9PEZI|nr:WD40 repeat-like protein [Ascodesmis nigricans]
MSTDKRKAPETFTSTQLVKRTRPDSTAVALADRTGGNGALIQAVPRTSGLQAPIMELNGHGREILAVRFDPSGHNIASAGLDRSILLWRTFGDCSNYLELQGHKGAILDLQWTRDSRVVLSASADMMLASWDSETGGRIRRYMGHEEVVNAMDVAKRGPELMVSASDDGTVGVWDPRQKECVDYLETSFPVTAVAMSETGNEIFTGSIDNDIKAWDLRKRAVVYSLRGHQDIITSLAVSPDGQTLLSNSMDNTVRTFDIRPFSPSSRQINVYEGAPHGIEKNLIRASWSPNGEKIAAGSGDGTVVVWETDSRKMLYKLPGHRGTVNDARFSPNVNEPIIVSASSDQSLILGELGK